MSAILKKQSKSPFPALHVKRRNEPVATDTVYSDTTTLDNDCKHTQIFVGNNTMFTDIYGMKTDSQFVNTLEGCIRDRGAMSQLISDSDVIRALCIGDWQSGPHHQHQNPAERRYQTVK